MIRIFPVAGPTSFSNDFGGARGHQGNDLFAPETTPLVAVDDGVIRFGTDPLGGNIANLRTPDGTRYYYAHLHSFEGSNRPVRSGDVIGYLGRTGNAATTLPHLHFEIHPGGGGAINPHPLLSTAPRVETPSSSARRQRSPLAVLLLAGAAGLGVWALMNPSSARAFTRRILPV